MGRTEDPPSSSGTPTHSEPTISENTLERERYSEGPLEPYSAHEIHGTSDHESVPYKDLSPIPTSMSSLQRTEAGVATAIGEANREHRLAVGKDETGATAKSSPPAEEKDKDIKFIKFIDAIGRRFRFSSHLVKTWSGMEHMIKETFLLVPNLNLRVADGEYDLFGPQEEILSPSHWESVIEPDWEITMRMWPNSELPPWEDASPMVILQRDNFRAGKEDERSKRSIPQQEQNAPYRNSEPLLFRDPGAYRRERPATYAVGDVGIEQRRPRIWNEPRPYTTEKPTTEPDAVRRPRDRSRSPPRRRHRERNTDERPPFGEKGRRRMAKHQKEARSTNRTQSGDEAIKSRIRRPKSLRMRQAGCLYPVRFGKGRRLAPIITSG